MEKPSPARESLGGFRYKGPGSGTRQAFRDDRREQERAGSQPWGTFLAIRPLYQPGFFQALLLAVMFTAAPLVRAQEPADAPAKPIEYTDEQKFALKALDAEFARFDATLLKVNDQQYRNQSKVYLDILKLRADRIRLAFDQTKYDELRFDLNSEYQRVSLWLANPVHSVPLPKDASITSPVLYRLKPEASNRADITKALAEADREIARIQARTDRAPAGPPGESERQRLRGIQGLRGDVEKNFSGAGWDRLVAAIKAELDRIPH